MNLPNYLTLCRLALIPFLVLFYYLPYQWAHYAASIIFALAAFTDYLDGLLARYFNNVSKFGEFLDPVADKLIVAVSLVLLTSYFHNMLLSLPALIIVSREILVSALREWMAELGKRASVAVSFIGKAKTALQMLAIVLLLAYRPDLPSIVMLSGVLFLYIASFLTLWSMFLYIRVAWPEFEINLKKKK